MEELKCCPFCGGAAEIKKEVSYAYYAECRRCEVRTKICYLEDGAIAAWNRRVTQNIGKKECCEQEGAV